MINPTVDPSLAVAIHNYMKKFDYHIELKLGPTWSEEYKEFDQWCWDNLGEKYKDWFVMGQGGSKDIRYTLHLRNSRWGVILPLRFPDLVDYTFDIK